MSVQCVWCGKDVEEIDGRATMDTCDDCEDYFEDHIDEIVAILDEMLLKNEKTTARSIKTDDDKNKIAWKSYALISAIHMLSSKPTVEFKDSKFREFLTR